MVQSMEARQPLAVHQRRSILRQIVHTDVLESFLAARFLKTKARGPSCMHANSQPCPACSSHTGMREHVLHCKASCQLQTLTQPDPQCLCRGLASRAARRCCQACTRLLLSWPQLALNR